ncbi:hypothetical protein ACWGQ2_14510 [Arthrobacter sp. NPDC055585]
MAPAPAPAPAAAGTSRKTLQAGIVLGIAGLVFALSTNLFMQNFGALNYNGENGLFVVLTQLYLLAPEACLSFSAAFIAAALVMRHLDVTRRASESGVG